MFQNQRAEAEITLQVVDKNDNSPKFIYNNSYNTIIKDKYLKVLSLNTKVGFLLSIFDYN